MPEVTGELFVETGEALARMLNSKPDTAMVRGLRRLAAAHSTVLEHGRARR